MPTNANRFCFSTKHLAEDSVSRLGKQAAIPSPHNKHTIGPLYSIIVSRVKPERKKPTLERFRPETKMRGRWIGYTALACVVGSFVLYSLWGWILAASAIALGKLGLDSNGRGPSLIALILGVVLMGVLLTVLIVGKENIDIMPK